MESEYIDTKEEDLPTDGTELQQIILVLQGVIKKLKAELKSTFHKLEKKERKVKKLISQNEDLHDYNKKLGKQLHKERKPPRLRNASIQTDSVCSEDQTAPETQLSKAHDDENNQEIVPAWSESKEEGMSIADSLKAAAEEALEETGVVFDENSGMYYDYSTGYYFDPDRSLYYEPHSGTYYYYNSSTGKYEFHSQVDLTQYAEPSSSKKGRSRKKDSDNDERDEPRKKHQKTRSKDEKLKTRKCSADDEKKEERHKSKKKKSKRKKEKLELEQDKVEEKETENGKEKEIKNDKNESNDANDDNVDLVEKESKEPKDDTEKERSIDGSANEESQEKDIEITEELAEEGEVSSNVDSEMEDGEISDSSGSEESDQSESEVEEQEETPAEETSALYYPPCIRAMVTESDSLDVGTLIIVTLTGTTIGREENLGHGILVPDEQVSKMHAEVRYHEEQRKYTIKDHASQNGTFVNGHRISESKVMSDPWILSNKDVIRIGGTNLTLHIHPGQETCDDCEPGIVRARYQAAQPEETVVASKAEKEKQRRRALNQIKKKYGLKEANYVDEGGSRVKQGYEDKAAIRRKTKGSDNPYQKDDMPASVDRAISAENKGRKLLAKMGWKEGSGLGRTEQGRAEPVQAFLRSKQSAGLGSSSSVQHSLDARPQNVQQSQRWLKAQERFMALTGVADDEEEEESETSDTTAIVQQKAKAIMAAAVPAKTSTISFVQGQTLVQNKDVLDSNESPDKK